MDRFYPGMTAKVATTSSTLLYAVSTPFRILWVSHHGHFSSLQSSVATGLNLQMTGAKYQSPHRPVIKAILWSIFEQSNHATWLDMFSIVPIKTRHKPIKSIFY